MRTITRFFLTFLLAPVFLIQPAFAGNSLYPEFHHGLKFQSDNKEFKIGVGGRLMNDWAWLNADSKIENLDPTAPTTWDSGTEFRRARLYVGGHIYSNIKFKGQYDFAGGKAKLKDAYIAITKLPAIGAIKVGRFKQSFGLEELTSSKYITLMERAMVLEAFAPSRQSGIRIGTHVMGDRLNWALSTFRLTDSYGKDYGSNDMNYSARVAATPWRGDTGLLHLGVAYASIKPNGSKVHIKARPEMHLAPTHLADTGEISADSETLIGLETAVVFGPASLQGEYIIANFSGAGGNDPSFSGYYAFVSYFITGESRPYKHGSFHRVKPNANLGSGSGFGALEVAGRYSYLNLTDSGVTGGEVTTSTFGLNWYLNPNTRVMLNYVSTELKNSGSAGGVMTRFQVDF